MVNIGIIGTGRIANDFCLAFKSLSMQNQKLIHQIVAVSSRNLLTAQQFAKQHAISSSFGSYQDMLKESRVDVVYVATPTSQHYEHVKLVLENNKSVLCEKTFTLNFKQGEELVKLARERGLFLMEANWMPFFPIFRRMIDLVNSDTIGRVKYVEANLGFQNNHQVNTGIIDPNLGGGALLACGIYPLSLACLVFNSFPTTVQALSSQFVNGVDETVLCQLQFEMDQVASISTSIGVNLSSEATIHGTKGKIHLNWMCCCPTKLTMTLNGEKDPIVYEEPLWNNISSGFNFPNSEGLAYEIQHVMDCLVDQRVESPIVTLAFTLNMLKLMDGIRQQIGLTYPNESTHK